MTLTDTGPMVALLSKRDEKHALCLATLPILATPLITTWACVSEAMHLLGNYGGHEAQDALWDYITNGLLEIHRHNEAECLQMRALMRRYCDTPMDFADASLVAIANTLPTRRVFTLDSDFFVYRLEDGAAFEVLPQSRS